MIWINFLISILIIFYSGRKLSTYGDIISDKTGLGGGFVGVILIGFITSLPELITTISSVSLVKDINLAWGNILGSNLLNITVLAFCDFLIKRGSVFRVFDNGNILTGLFSIIITAIACIGMITGKDIIFAGNISIYTFIVFFIYIFGSYILYRNALHQKDNSPTIQIENSSNHISTPKLAILFLINAALIVAAGVSITYTCDQISKITGLGSTFVGSLFLATATSLPEIVVSVVSIKMGALNLAIGNIIGSNFFNITILGLSDFFYRGGSLFTSSDKINLLTSTIFIINTNILLIGMLLKSKRRFFRLGIDSIFAISLYFITFYYIYKGIGNAL